LSHNTGPSSPTLRFEAPEFGILEATGTLKIAVTSVKGTKHPILDVPAVHVDRAAHLPIDAIETAHRALTPAAGVMRSSCDAILFGGQTVPAVEFVCDSIPSRAEQIAQPLDKPERFESLQIVQKEDLGAWIERLRAAGIYADRRASPDLLAQLGQAIKRPVDTVLCSALDSDPTACLGAALTRQFPQEVVAGAVLISRLVGATQTALCADQRVPSNWWSGVRKLIRKTPTRLIPMVNDYPQADPTLLLYTLLNRRLRPGRLPTEQGVIILDAAAAFSIGRRLLADEPMTHVPLAVRDHARKLSHFVMAPVGMQLTDLLTLLGERDTDTLIRGGDLLRDLVLTPDAVVSGSELVIHTSDPEPDINPDACIRCGWCTEACPTRVQPAGVLEAAQRDDIELAEDAGIEACIDCGICSYVCPSKLPLLEGIRVMKARHDV
jgi:Na+-translocating ferredoxin:NAD+ oxidoreductase subunit C